MLVSDTPLEGQNFGKVVLEGCTDVADVTKSACKEFGWGTPTQVRLYVAAAGGDDEPSADAIKSALSGARLQASWKLDRAGITEGSWLLARVPPPPAAAPGASRRRAGVLARAHSRTSAAHPSLTRPPPPSPMAAAAGGGGAASGGTPAWTANSLRTRLAEAGAPVDEHIVRRFITSRALQSSLSFCSTAADAAALYDQVAADPASETRANVLGETGICIDGDIIVPHRTTALFKWAFDGALPCVLKLPAAHGAAALECCLYDELGAEARAAGINLVPVRLLRIVGSRRVGTDTTRLSAGVLMPAYPLTLAVRAQSYMWRHGRRVRRAGGGAARAVSQPPQAPQSPTAPLGTTISISTSDKAQPRQRAARRARRGPPQTPRRVHRASHTAHARSRAAHPRRRSRHSRQA